MLFQDRYGTHRYRQILDRTRQAPGENCPPWSQASNFQKIGHNIKPPQAQEKAQKEATYEELRHQRTKKNDRVRSLLANCFQELKHMFSCRLEWHREMGKIRIQEKAFKHKPHVISVSNIPQSELKKHRYKKVERRYRRSMSMPQYVETLLVADTSTLEFHEDGDIETYLLTIMNMASTYFL